MDCRPTSYHPPHLCRTCCCCHLSSLRTHSSRTPSTPPSPAAFATQTHQDAKKRGKQLSAALQDAARQAADHTTHMVQMEAALRDRNEALQANTYPFQDVAWNGADRLMGRSWWGFACSGPTVSQQSHEPVRDRCKPLNAFVKSVPSTPTRVDGGQAMGGTFSFTVWWVVLKFFC